MLFRSVVSLISNNRSNKYVIARKNFVIWAMERTKCSQEQIAKAIGRDRYTTRDYLRQYLADKDSINPKAAGAPIYKVNKKTLTERHKQVMEMMQRGMSKGEIASELKLAAKTVGDHMLAIKRRTEV